VDRKDFRQRFPDLAAGLPDDDLDALIGSLRVRALVQGDRLVEQGSPAEGAWLVFDGTLGVTVGLGRRTVSLGRVTQGAMVGEVSFVDGGPATATLTAQGPVTALELTPAAVDELARTKPRAAAAVNRAACDALATHLVNATDKLQALRAGQPGQARMEDVEGESLLDALRELLGLGRR
jgi:CRP/FNR family transcriptional regulator, cyclic AMP receptor protein